MTDRFFAEDRDGLSTFYPWGKSVKGYALKDKPHEEKLRKLLSSMNIIFFCSLFLLGITIGWAFGIILLPFYYLTLFLIAQSYTKGLEKVEPLSSSRLFWKIYFWFIFAILILSYISEGISGTWGIIDLVMSSGALAGLFLYGYKKKLFAPIFWKTYFVVFIVWDISYNLIIEPKSRGEAFETITLLGFLFVIPIYIALYLYAFKYVDDNDD
jgi:hypothetical protein